MTDYSEKAINATIAKLSASEMRPVKWAYLFYNYELTEKTLRECGNTEAANNIHKIVEFTCEKMNA